MILLLSVLFQAASPDSLVLASADSLLRRQDTVQALERLQSHADTARVSAEVVNLLDRLVLPEWPSQDTLQRDGSSAARAVAPSALPRRPRWILSTQIGRDEGDALPFWMSLQAIRRSWRTWGGWMVTGDWGASQLHAEAPSGRLSRSEAMVREDLSRGHWLASGSLWMGLDQDLDVDGGTAGSLLRVDTFSFGVLSVGPHWRWSGRLSRWIGASVRCEVPHGAGLSGGLRWRRDPELRVEQKGVRFQAASGRVQAFGAGSWLVALGAWRVGPAVDFDWRSSTDADSWQDSLGVVQKTRRELTWTAGAQLGLTREPGWSLRIHPAWVFSSSESLVAEDEVATDGLRVALDGVLVF